MSRSRGKRYDDTPKLNIKKVIATIIAILVVIMFIISLKNLLTRDEKTKEVSTLTTYISVFENNKWGVIDNSGNVIIEPTYDEMIIIPDRNKEIFICTYDVDYQNETFKTKVLNASGKEIFENFENVQPFENNDGGAIWYEEDVLKYQKDGKYGIIDFSGKEILSADYDNIYVLNGVKKSIIIEKDGKKGLVSGTTGEVIIEPKFSEISALASNYEAGYIVKDFENKYGVITLDKKNTVEVKYDEVKKVTGNNYYVVVENGKLEVIDNTGNIILNDGYDSIEEINSNNLVIIKDNKYGVISIEGKDIISPEYEDLKYISNDKYIAKKDGKYGIINSDNEVKIDFTYEKISYIKEADFLEAENENYKTDIFDADLKKVLEEIIISELNIEKGYLRVRTDNEYKYYNFKFEEKTNLDVLTTNTLFLFKENGKYGYKNKNGEVIVDPIYDDAKEQNEFGYCAINKDGLWGALKSDGTVIVKPSKNLDENLYIDFISTWYRYNDLSLNVYTK